MSGNHAVISDRYCHHRLDKYLIKPIDVGPKKKDWVLLASALYITSSDHIASFNTSFIVTFSKNEFQH